jgi:hypothetical protein
MSLPTDIYFLAHLADSVKKRYLPVIAGDFECDVDDRLRHTLASKFGAVVDARIAELGEGGRDAVFEQLFAELHPLAAAARLDVLAKGAFVPDFSLDKILAANPRVHFITFDIKYPDGRLSNTYFQGYLEDDVARKPLVLKAAAAILPVFIPSFMCFTGTYRTPHVPKAGPPAEPPAEPVFTAALHAAVLACPGRALVLTLGDVTAVDAGGVVALWDALQKQSDDDYGDMSPDYVRPDAFPGWQRTAVDVVAFNCSMSPSCAPLKK